MVSSTRGSEHRITIPRHRPLRVGTLAGILKAEVLDGEVWLLELQAQPAAGSACVGVGGVQAEDGVVLLEFALPPALGGVDVVGEGVAGFEVVGVERDGAQVVDPGFLQGRGLLETVVELRVELPRKEWAST
ncbi:MAG: hypothetical protein QN172_10395 [Armatimonadota bacterium]|nr:hypothetical protein [Armatimonadota bacterium]MDR7602849.1 hypothetical protein [Armatimonadota bacterium]